MGHFVKWYFNEVEILRLIGSPFLAHHKPIRQRSDHPSDANSTTKGPKTNFRMSTTSFFTDYGLFTDELPVSNAAILIFPKGGEAVERWALYLCDVDYAHFQAPLDYELVKRPFLEYDDFLMLPKLKSLNLYSGNTCYRGSSV